MQMTVWYDFLVEELTGSDGRVDELLKEAEAAHAVGLAEEDEEDETDVDDPEAE